MEARILSEMKESVIFAPERTDGREISLGGWNQHPGKRRETQEEGWKSMTGFKTNKKKTS